ncbi:MAG: UDP-N-acetylmuramate dehydrogenase [Planctomycetota bacterium]|jgi:UDP-N-acetylmuramate dehydrogenase
MSIFDGLEKIVQTNYPLAKHTWLGIGGPADYFIRPDSVEQLKEVINRCNENNIPVYVLGFGSNLLINDEGIKGAVIKLDSEEFKQTQLDGEMILAWAGADLGSLVRECVRKGLSGLEALTGIPGSMGGAVRMNAGGSFGDIGTVVETVTLMDNFGNIFKKSKPELAFDYRQSNITAKFILNAQLKLTTTDPEQALKTVKEVWIYKKNTQPLEAKNAGCVFKNPRGVSAGALIDRAALKGLQVGGAAVSEKHANFIIAKKDCTYRDIVQLLDAIKDRVKEEFDVDLKLELEIWE